MVVVFIHNFCRFFIFPNFETKQIGANDEREEALFEDGCQWTAGKR